MAAIKPLAIAYTPDSDDAFYYDALETGRVPLSGYQPVFSRRPVSALNGAARRGVYDVTAISAVIYPLVARRYAILSVGASVGRGYGPVLVSKDERTIESLRGCRIGVPGAATTGCFLLRCLCPKAVLVEMVFDQIAEAVAAGKLEAGVMIHEELLYYPRLGLRRVADLGAEWCQRHDLPLPVGLNVIRRSLGQAAMQRICAAIRRSLEYSLEHSADVLARVKCLGRGAEGQCTERFIAMFANQDSVRMPADVRSALRVLFCQVADLGLSPLMPPIDIIEGSQHGFTMGQAKVA
ncbi:MAG TPA: MqnA/MqnD/SBP family protein [Gemmataceae bacterium]|jgi:1,4-dihydroxy-6-naphthoate synthase|nr:MqnA/MqnD/SBP family protein [Gemmataceae bacterium]